MLFTASASIDEGTFDKIITNLRNKNLAYLDTLERKLESFTFQNPDEGIRVLNRILSNEWAFNHCPRFKKPC